MAQRPRPTRARTRTQNASQTNTGATVILPNGAAEITFQANIASAPAMAEPTRAPTCHLAERNAASPPRPTTPAGRHVRFVEDSPAQNPAQPLGNDDPFILPAHALTNNRRPAFLLTPPSVGGEVFPEPSPSESDLMDETPSRRRTHTQSVRSIGTPRAGPHSPFRSPRASQTSKSPVSRKTRANDVWTFVKLVAGKRECIFCQKCRRVDPNYNVSRFSQKTGTSVLREHLMNEHLSLWVNACDEFSIKIRASYALEKIALHRQQKSGKVHTNGLQGACDTNEMSPTFSADNFIDALVEWIVATDQSINTIESPHLRMLFRMLHPGLLDKDIPHRTSLRNRIEQIWKDHLAALEHDMKDALGKISHTTDLWSDSNLAPFMAVTSHWIHATPVESPQGKVYNLTLRSDLIGFHRVPGRHTGKHLAHAFTFVLDRLDISHKIGWLTMDNAGNNGTMVEELENILSCRGIVFDAINHRIRCFPHIINLACKAVLAALTNLNYAKEPTTEAEFASALEVVDHDPIATLRALIRMIRASSLRRQHFSQLVKMYLGIVLQLLRDVDTRWGSTFLMIQRALDLQQALDSITNSEDFKELKKYHLNGADWDALRSACSILEVPFAFQQRLSAQKTPTLCDAIPSFEAMIRVWRDMQSQLPPRVSDVIQDGIDKLEVYLERTETVPAYVVAMFLNPEMKLQFYAEQSPHKLEWAKDIIHSELRPYHEKYLMGLPTSQSSDRNSTTDRSEVTRTNRSLAHGGAHGQTPAANYTPRRSRSGPVPTAHVANNIRKRTANEILGLSRPVAVGSVRSLDAEIAAYLLDAHAGNSDTLTYWQENQLRYPVLFLAAVDHLAIQGSAVPCERVFSSSKETMRDRRNRISYKLMEQLQMLKYAFRDGKTCLDFGQGLREDEIVQHLESSMDGPESIPEDIHSYIESLMSVVDV